MKKTIWMVLEESSFVPPGSLLVCELFQSPSKNYRLDSSGRLFIPLDTARKSETFLGKLMAMAEDSTAPWILAACAERDVVLVPTGHTNSPDIRYCPEVIS